MFSTLHALPMPYANFIPSHPLLHDVLSLPRFAITPIVPLTPCLIRGLTSRAPLHSFWARLAQFCVARTEAMSRPVSPQLLRTLWIDGVASEWEKVPNQRNLSGYSYVKPSTVSAAGFSSVVPPSSEYPNDIGWETWGAGLLIVYSHDGPFGIYGSRFFVPFPRDSREERPVEVQNYDSREQILFTSLMSAAGRWTATLPQNTRYFHGNWWLLRMFGDSNRRADFGYHRKSRFGFGTIRAVAAVSFSFHRAFGAIRCSGECRFSKTLGSFCSDHSCNAWTPCFECVDPKEPYFPMHRPRTYKTRCTVDNKTYDVELGKTETQLPSAFGASHPVCGHCRDAEDTRNRYWSSDEDGGYPCVSSDSDHC